MTTTDPTPASMGEPLSEAERTAEIQARLDAFHLHAGRPPWDEHVSRNRAALERNAPGDLAHLLSRVGVLEGQLATAQALHKPERRYTPDDGETSYATYSEAADASFDGTGRPAMVTFFEVCSHCASIEMAEGCDHQYKESLWPCKEGVALGLDGGGSEAETPQDRTTAPDTAMDEFEAADEAFRRWE